MGVTLLMTISDYFMNKMEKDVVALFKLKFFCRCVDGTYNKRNKNQPVVLFGRIKKYHPKINLTIELNTSKFLDAKNYRHNNATKCVAHHKEMKFLFHWTSAVPKQYKNNVIIRDLHHVKNLSSHFEEEVKIIRKKDTRAAYPFHFINSVIDSFLQEKEVCIIPTNSFEERKEVSFQIPVSKSKKEISRIINKLEVFTN